MTVKVTQHQSGEPEIKRKACSAYGQTCRGCGKRNHFRNRVSKDKERSRNTCRLDENEVSDNEPRDEDEKHTFSLSTKQSLKNEPLLKFKAQGTPVTIMANSGAISNILDEEDEQTRED